MGKISQILIVVFVVAIFVGSAIWFGFSGVVNGEYNYVKVEVNPKVEFLTDKNDKIISVFPVNAEAKELLINENFIGQNVKDGAKKFVELCVLSNYIDVEKENNAVKLTIVSDLMQNLDVKIYSEIKKYFINNEIKSVIVENKDDLEIFKQAKKYGVSNNKFVLMQSVCNLYPDTTLEENSKLSEKELLKKIKTGFDTLENNVLTFTDEELNNKTKLLKLNKAKINHHNENITNKSISEFVKAYNEYEKEHKSNFEKNFNSQYKNWEENKSNLMVS